ncbi:MAG: PilZ domain-containing protein [Deltaproteobacteria bacterium]|nr:PilZ domain-containing protein [Deltaproteobacteria bacterium]
MFSIKGIYENGKIRLSEPLDLKENSDVIITFLDDEQPFIDTSSQAGGDSTPDFVETEDKNEQYYERLREHKRFKAKGEIHITEDEGGQVSYPLNDYSAGGLSFISDKIFDVSQIITATLKYRASGELLVMDFDIEIKRVITTDTDYKIGCQFVDAVDEDLWHMVMGT